MAWTSDRRPPAICDGSIDGIECRGNDCDDIQLTCRRTDAAGMRTDFGPELSDGDRAYVCPDGYLVSDLRCGGSYCDRLSLQCSKARGGTTDCRWLNQLVTDTSASGPEPFKIGPVALENDDFLSGIECHGKYCDDKRLRICRVLGPVPVEVHG